MEGHVRKVGNQGAETRSPGEGAGGAHTLEEDRARRRPEALRGRGASLGTGAQSPVRA